MSPSSPHLPSSSAARATLRRLLVRVGSRIHDERVARGWSLRELGRRARLSPAAVQSIEAGEAGSLDAYARLTSALGLQLGFELTDPRRRERLQRTTDPVHSLMGEFEAGHLRRLGHPAGLDEPYQHYQFAGRADVVAWDLDTRALLHIENRSRFPDFQETAGAFNAKRAYLGAALAERLSVPGWASETHVIAALWSSEVLHAIRLRPESFRSLCPDDMTSFEAWWAGTPPARGKTSSLIVLDPLAVGRQRRFIGLDEAVTGTRPRHRGYADVAAKLMRAD